MLPPHHCGTRHHQRRGDDHHARHHHAPRDQALWLPPHAVPVTRSVPASPGGRLLDFCTRLALGFESFNSCLLRHFVQGPLLTQSRGESCGLRAGRSSCSAFNFISSANGLLMPLLWLQRCSVRLSVRTYRSCASYGRYDSPVQRRAAVATAAHMGHQPCSSGCAHLHS